MVAPSEWHREQIYRAHSVRLAAAALHRHGKQLAGGPSEHRRPLGSRPGSPYLLPARGEPASKAVLRAPLGQTLAAIGVDTEIEMRSAALRHRQGVAQPVVPSVPGGPDAEARRPDQTPPTGIP